MRKAIKTIAFDGTEGNGATGARTLFRVSGLVRVVPFAVCEDDLTSVGDTATVELGVAGKTESILAQFNQNGCVDGYIVTAGNATANVDYPVNNGAVDTTLISGGSEPIDVIMTVAGEDITGGRLTFGLAWQSLLPGSSVQVV